LSGIDKKLVFAASSDKVAEHNWSCLEKILHAPVFGGAETSRNLLLFLAQRAIENPKCTIKEHEIATEVLGRGVDFDPRIDSVVRVQIGRLRSKLAEYYLSDGSKDEVIVEIPKGAYHLFFRPKDSEGTANPETGPAQAIAADRPRPTRTALKAQLGWILAAALALTVVYLVARPKPIPKPVVDPLPATSRFWGPFIRSTSDPVVIYSNPQFAGSTMTGLRPFRSGIDTPNELVDVYTGIGDVKAIHDITELLSHFNRRLRLVRAGLPVWDQARDRDLVLLGGPDDNAVVRQLAPLLEFNFKQSAAEPKPMGGAIVNEHPLAGESREYFASKTWPLQQDYAMIALIPGFMPGRRVLLLEGTTTFGTQAAAEFVCQEHSLAELLSRLGGPQNAPVPDFEALLSIEVHDEFPIDSKLVSVRLRKAN